MFREDEALEIAQEFVEKHKLKVSLLGVKREEELTTFFFSAPERVNFRGLSRDLRNIFETEIRFTEAGPREKARHLGGLGRCGLPLCCKAWLPQIPQVPLESLEKASLPIAPEKFTGACGRLLCCLVYEDEEWCKEAQGWEKATQDKEEARAVKEKSVKEEKEKTRRGSVKPIAERKKRVRKLRL